VVIHTTTSLDNPISIALQVKDTGKNTQSIPVISKDVNVFIPRYVFDDGGPVCKGKPNVISHVSWVI
jgi:hypothetical protein